MLGTRDNPIHASTLNKLVDTTDYSAPGGRVWARTVAGTAFHELMLDMVCCVSPKSAREYFDSACDAELSGVQYGRTQTPDEMVARIEQYRDALLTKWTLPQNAFAEWSFLLCLQIDGRSVWFEGTADLFAPQEPSIYDYKTGESAPDYTHSAQHHLYCLAALRGVWSNPRHFRDRHQLDWTTAEYPPHPIGVWPRFRYLHLPRMVGSQAGAWNILALGTDGYGMTEANSLEYITELTRKLLAQQPTTIETEPMTQPQAMIPAQQNNLPANAGVAVKDEVDIFRLGKVFADSQFFKDCRDANQAVVKILAGKELGLPPFQSMSGIHVIQGKATMGATLIAARIKGSGKYDYTVIEMGETRCAVEFFELRGQQRISIGKSEFTDTDARKAGTQNMGKFPRNMLFARAISNGAKWFTPDIFGGPIYVPEEMQEEPEPAPRQIKAEVVEPAPQPAAPVYSWGTTRGAGYATEAQINRLKANCDALKVGEQKFLKRCMEICSSTATTLADLTEAQALKCVLRTDDSLAQKGIARPDREPTAAEQAEIDLRKIVGPELRTNLAKELAEIIRNGPLSADDVIDIMANEGAPDTQFTAFSKEVQAHVLAAVKAACDAKLNRMVGAGSNGKH